MSSSFVCAGDIIVSLLTVPLLERSDAERRTILTAKPPTSKLRLDGQKWRTFHVGWYRTHPWLCASSVRNKLFCWPCLLLMGGTKSVWNTKGLAGLENIAKCLKKHAISRSHLNNYLEYKELRKNALAIVDEQNAFANISSETCNDINKKVIRKLIKVLCAIMKGNQSRSVENEPDLKTLREFPQTTVLKECIRGEIRKLLEKEINDSPFFGCAVDEVDDKCSITIRFVDQAGEVRDYFLGLFDLPDDKTKAAAAIHKLLLKVLEKFDMKTKLVGQSYDGRIVPWEQLSALQKSIKDSAPHALSTHCCFGQRLNLILQQSCCTLPNVKTFFSTLKSIAKFFNFSLKGISVSTPIHYDDIDWQSNALAAFLRERETLIQAFDEFLNHPGANLNLSLKREAECLKGELHKREFIFYSKVFTDIFRHIELLYDVLENNKSDMQYCSFSIFRHVEILKRWKHHEADVFSKYFVHEESADIVEYKRIFFEIVDNVTGQLEQRLAGYEKLDFLQLGDTKKFINYGGNFLFQEFLNSLIDVYGAFFDKSALRTELDTLYSRAAKANFHDTTLVELVTKMNEDNTNEILPECYKLFCLICTISVAGPRIVLSPDRLTSKLSSLIDRLMKDETFVDNVTETFLKRKDINVNELFSDSADSTESDSSPEDPPEDLPAPSNPKRPKLDEPLDQSEFVVLNPADSQIKIEKHELEEEEEEATMNYEEELSTTVQDEVIEPETSQSVTRHPIQAFFDSMAFTVMQFPPSLAVCAKMDVFQVISKLELEMLNTQSGPNT